jgi:tetratricopeptide (TPR) repeat protein
LGLTWERKDDAEQALAAYEKALELKPDYAQAHSSLRLLYWRQNDRARAGGVPPSGHVRSRSRRGALQSRAALAQSETLDEAVRELSEAISLNPEYTDARVQLGLVLNQKNDAAGASSVFPELVRRDPNFAEAHNNLGLVLLQAGDLREARKEFVDAVRLKPRYAEAHYNLALTLHREGNEVESRAEFDKAYEIAPALKNAPPPGTCR